MSSRKEEIRTVAAYMFRKKGYKASSMRNIAEKVGIEAPSIYNHFDSKQDILSELLLSIGKAFTKGMSIIKNGDSTTDQKLKQLLALHVRLTIEYPNAVALIAGEWVHLKESALQQYIQLRDDYENDFKTIINKGKKEGIFKDIDTDIALFSILSTLRWLYSWHAKNQHYDQYQLEEQLSRVLLEGIYKN